MKLEKAQARIVGSERIEVAWTVFKSNKNKRGRKSNAAATSLRKILSRILRTCAT